MPEPRKRLGRTGLTCHPLGFGSYRIAAGNPIHEEALRLYLERGGNLIDTSSNYGDGLSERLVGKVLADRGREGVIVVTKGGYVQGSNLELARERDFPEMVRYGPGIWHCIHPEFLATQIERSLERMGLDRVDAYLLHNPEYYLQEIAHRRPVTEDDVEAFYGRIHRAFAWLEEQVAAGRIGWYGVSSNHFGLPGPPEGGSPTATSVGRCLREAGDLAEDHHFAVVQLPLNLFEPGGALQAKEEDGGATVLELAAREGLGVLANRPLNAFHLGSLVRLADWHDPEDGRPGAAELRKWLEPLAEHEADLPAELGPRPAPALFGAEPETVADRIVEIATQLADPGGWERSARRHLVDPLQGWLAERRAEHGGEIWQRWERELLLRLQEAFEAVGRWFAASNQPISDEIRRRLHEAGYPKDGASLSRAALSVLTNLEGLSCVLVGMRRPSYVEDAMAAADPGDLDGRAVLERLSREPLP